MTVEKIRLALVDDHRTVRQAISGVLCQYDFIDVIFEAENGNELMKKVSKHEPHVILLDNKMPVMNGLEVLKLIYKEYPSIKVLMLTAFLDDVYVCECLKYGINGFLTKNMEISEIVKAIKLAYNNEVYFNNLIGNFFFRDYVSRHSKQSNTILPDFSDEEIKLIQLIHQEKRTEEIAEIMFLSKRSIELKRDKMKEKANVRSTIGLLLHCIKRGIIEA